MKRLACLVITLVIFLNGCAMPSFKKEAKALLDDAGIQYELNGCYGGWLDRSMHCEVKISEAEIEKLKSHLGLDQSLRYVGDGKRMIIVPASQKVCSAALRKKYRPAFHEQQWNPSRHGYFSVIVFYQPETSKACVFLSIAYG